MTLPRPAALQLNLKSGHQYVLHASRAASVQSFIQSFLIEFRTVSARSYFVDFHVTQRDFFFVQEKFLREVVEKSSQFLFSNVLLTIILLPTIIRMCKRKEKYVSAHETVSLSYSAC